VAKPRRHLNNAPIREAVIDIAISPKVDLQTITAVTDALVPPFEKRSDIWEATVGFQFNQAGAHTQKGRSSKVGVRFDSVQPPHVLQYRTNGFTFSRLTPYEDWSHVRDAAKPCWARYSESVEPCKVTKLSVRYINALRLPIPSRDFAEFLTAAPQLPAELPQTLTGFLQRVVMATESYSAAVTQSLESVLFEQQQIVVMLDIDVWRSVALAPTDPSVWSVLDDLRNAKNEIFFSHLTEKAVDIFA
jgi:uncharacterized protein (TIGR04255 family)